jgi:hypothetical protein
VSRYRPTTRSVLRSIVIRAGGNAGGFTVRDDRQLTVGSHLDLRCAEHLHLGGTHVLAPVRGGKNSEQPESRSVPDEAEVEHPIVGARLGRNKDSAAVAAGIAHRAHHVAALSLLASRGDTQVRRPEGDQAREDPADVCEPPGPPPGTAIGARGNVGVEADARGGAEPPAVHDAEVNPSCCRFDEMASRSRGIERDPECRREIIAPPSWKNSKGGVTPCQSVHTLMRGTVTTADENSLGTTNSSVTGNAFDVSARRCYHDLEVMPELA